jgi:hypothetical protein
MAFQCLSVQQMLDVSKEFVNLVMKIEAQNIMQQYTASFCVKLSKSATIQR